MRNVYSQVFLFVGEKENVSLVLLKAKNGWLASPEVFLGFLRKWKVVMGVWMKVTRCSSLELFKPLILLMKWFQGELEKTALFRCGPRTIRYKLAVSNHSEKPIIIGLSDVSSPALVPFCSESGKRLRQRKRSLGIWHQFLGKKMDFIFREKNTIV